MDLNEKGIAAAEAAHVACTKDGCDDVTCNGLMCRGIIRAYLSATVPADVAGLVDRLAEAINDARYDTDMWRDRERPTWDMEDRSSREYAYRLARAAEKVAATALSAMAAENEANDEEWRASLQAEYERAERHKKRAEAADAEIARLRDAIAEKDKALEPFAKEADQWEGFNDDECLVEGWPGSPASSIKVTHLRAARRAHGGQVDAAE